MEEYKSLDRLTRSINKACRSLSNTEQVNGKSDNLITLNIGGTIFTTRTSTTKAVPDSLLSKLDENSKYFNQSQQVYYFDRDADLFKGILNAHRDGEIHVPRDVCPIKFRKEIKFWGIPYRMLAPCCWKIFYEPDNDLETLDHLALYTNNTPTAQVDTSTPRSNNEKVNNVDTATGKEDFTARQSKLWLFLNEPTSSTAAKVWCYFYILVVLLSTVVYIIWLEPGVRVEKYLSKPNSKEIAMLARFPNISRGLILNEKMTRLFTTDPHPVLFALDIFCIIFFITELIIHFVACPRKLGYFKSIHNDIKAILAITMTISLVYEVRKDFFIENSAYGLAYFVFKSCNVLRLLLIFQLRKLYGGLQIVFLSIEKSCKELILLVITFVLAVTMYGSLIFVCEIESEMFPDMLTSMWWALITMTTVGYGDFYPTRSVGYLAGALCAINGLIVIALPVAAIASNFSVFYSRNAELEKHLATIKQTEKGKVFQEKEKDDMEDVVALQNASEKIERIKQTLRVEDLEG